MPAITALTARQAIAPGKPREGRRNAYENERFLSPLPGLIPLGCRDRGPRRFAACPRHPFGMPVLRQSRSMGPAWSGCLFPAQFLDPGGFELVEAFDYKQGIFGVAVPVAEFFSHRFGCDYDFTRQPEGLGG
jgi:hypothetical protein